MNLEFPTQIHKAEDRASKKKLLTINVNHLLVTQWSVVIILDLNKTYQLSTYPTYT